MSTNIRGWYYLSGSTFLSGVNDTQWEACAALVSVHMLYILFRKNQTFSSQRLYSLASVSSLLERHQEHLCILVHMILLDLAPKHFAKYNWFVSTRSTRHSFSLPRANTSLFLKSPIFSGHTLWSSLPTSLKACTDIKEFKLQVLRPK